MSIVQRINAERVVVLGWGRAILMQLAHPLVAQGVADHSTFRASPVARARRLHETIGAMLSLTFGSPAAAREAAARINAIHDRVHGVLKESVGRFPAGTCYSATDIDLLVWVQATLMDSLPLAYDALVAPLSAEAIDEYCAEVAESSPILRIPAGRVPESRAALDKYLADVYASGILAVSPAARELAHEVITPLWPAGHVLRLATIGWLPPSIRVAYGFTWSNADDRRLRRWCRRIRFVRRHSPEWLMKWRVALDANHRVHPSA
jgi:uncharacterized protein (DUF2236 family)